MWEKLKALLSKSVAISLVVFTLALPRTVRAQPLNNNPSGISKTDDALALVPFIKNTVLPVDNSKALVVYKASPLGANLGSRKPMVGLNRKSNIAEWLRANNIQQGAKSNAIILHNPGQQKNLTPADPIDIMELLNRNRIANQKARLARGAIPVGPFRLGLPNPGAAALDLQVPPGGPHAPPGDGPAPKPMLTRFVQSGKGVSRPENLAARKQCLNVERSPNLVALDNIKSFDSLPFTDGFKEWVKEVQGIKSQIDRAKNFVVLLTDAEGSFSFSLSNCSDARFGIRMRPCYNVHLKNPSPEHVHDIKTIFSLGSTNTKGIGKVYTKTKVKIDQNGNQKRIWNGLCFQTDSKGESDVIVSFFKENRPLLKRHVFNRYVQVLEKIYSRKEIAPEDIWTEIILPAFYSNTDGNNRKNSLDNLEAMFRNSNGYKEGVKAGVNFLFPKTNPFE